MTFSLRLFQMFRCSRWFWHPAAALLLSACGTVLTEPPPAAPPHIDEAPSAAPLEPTASGSYLAGRAAEIDMDTANAAAYYLKAFSFDPLNPNLGRRSYFYLLADGQIAKAIPQAKALLAMDPKDSMAALTLSVEAASRRSWNEALQRLPPHDLLRTDSLLVPLVRAWILQGQGKTDQALASLAPMQNRKELSSIHDFHAALILDLAGRPQQADIYYRKILASPNPPPLRSAQIVADFLSRQGQTEKAGDLFASYREGFDEAAVIASGLIQSDGNEKPVRNALDGLAEALYQTSASVAQAQSFESALVFGHLSLLARPDFPLASLLIGNILQAMERWEAAAGIFAAIPPNSPLYVQARLRLAESETRLEHPERAREILTTLLESHPLAVEAQIQLGDLERNLKHWDAAVSAYQTALNHLEENRQRTWALRFSLGVALERAKRWPEAEQQFLKALKQEPHQPLILNYLGYSWIDRGINLEEGKAMIEKAVALRPNEGTIIDSLGWAYFRLGNPTQALQELERAVELEPADPAVNDHLGDVYWTLGRTMEAGFQWKRALSLNPDPALRETLEKKLKDGLDPQPPLRAETP